MLCPIILAAISYHKKAAVANIIKMAAAIHKSACPAFKSQLSVKD
jgi:hypothetical protein